MRLLGYVRCRTPSVAAPTLWPRYSPRRPTEGALYTVVAEHFAKFTAAHARLPEFVTCEFDAYLRCGLLEYGFAECRCTRCGLWAALLARVFRIDVSVCPVCRGAMTIARFVTDPNEAAQLVAHIPRPPPAAIEHVQLPLPLA